MAHTKFELERLNLSANSKTIVIIYEIDVSQINRALRNQCSIHIYLNYVSKYIDLGKLALYWVE